MKSLLFTALMLLIFSTCNWAQQDTTKSQKSTWDYDYKNVVKIGVIAAAFSNISVSYERSIKPRWTVGLNAGYKYKGDTPTLFGLDSTSITMTQTGINGFSITPETRYYLKSCENQSPNGFYVSLYMRYVNYSTAVNFIYYPNYPDKEVVNNIGANATLNEFGIGFMLGYQLLIKERFIVDFIIIGPRRSWINMKYEFDNNVSEEFLTTLEGKLQEVVDRFGFDHEVNIEKSGSREAKYSFNFTNVRFGISLGYAF